MSAARRDEHGFVLSLVIFAVAALSIAGTALFLIVQSENAMANAGAESSTALHLANAGLARYMGESLGVPDPEVIYEMGGATITVRAQPASTLGDSATIYLIRSEAVITDRRVPALASRRSVQQYARLRRLPFRPVASLAVASGDLKTRNVTIDGRDGCSTGSGPVAGIAMTGNGDARGSLNGSPSTVTQSYAAMMAAIGLDWATMLDPATTFDYVIPQQAWPNFAALAPGVYPTIRVDGDFRAHASRSGRGLLVVTGQLDLENSFTWDGVILAGRLPRNTHASATINGTLLTGFAGDNGSVDLHNTRIFYNSCTVRSAASGISMFSPMANTWWESVD